MKPKFPMKPCPFCNTRKLPVLNHVWSRVYADWDCPECGGTWRTDAATGKLITRVTTPESLEGVK